MKGVGPEIRLRQGQSQPGLWVEHWANGRTEHDPRRNAAGQKQSESRHVQECLHGEISRARSRGPFWSRYIPGRRVSGLITQVFAKTRRQHRLARRDPLGSCQLTHALQPFSIIVGSLIGLSFAGVG